MVLRELVSRYNGTRNWRDKSVVCHAPSINLSFNQQGNGLAYSDNRTVILGTYPQHSIKEMWFGATADELREAMRRKDLSTSYLSLGYQLMSRKVSGIISSFNDDAEKREAARQKAPWRRNIKTSFKSQPAIEFPTSMQFSLTNVCNLECVMCSGYYSSSIRHHREHLPSLPSPYDAGFVEQLEEFIPSLRVAKFLGGEPFLIEIYYEIWNRIRRLNPEIEVSITTNATILSERAKEILQNLTCHMVVSVDSLEKETYESIRMNASYDQVMQNVEYLMAYKAGRGRSLTFTVCPMQQNWMEIPSMVEYCNQRRVGIWFNSVFHPPHCSLRNLGADELARVVDYWNACEVAADDELTALNRRRFRSFMNQVIQWRNEALNRGALVPELGERRAAFSDPLDIRSLPSGTTISDQSETSWP